MVPRSQQGVQGQEPAPTCPDMRGATDRPGAGVWLLRAGWGEAQEGQEIPVTHPAIPGRRGLGKASQLPHSSSASLGEIRLRVV